jgi:predicted PurR-regulated permease PerM
MLLVGFVGNTLFISMYLRPKIAAEKSHVLNFYWMFLALVTGVYTFGLMGIIIGPVLISVLKAVLDALTARQPAAAAAAAVEPAWTAKSP